MLYPIRVCCLLVGVTTALFVANATAQQSADDTKEAKSESPEVAEVRRAVSAYRESLGKGDIDGVLACWTPTADYVDQVGRAYKTHAMLTLAKSLSQEGKHLPHLAPHTESGSIRLVTPDVAVEDGKFERHGATAGHATHGRYTTLWVKRNGKWLIDGVRESPARLESSTEALSGLSWMIGDWLAEGPVASAEISCAWGHNKTYILAQIKMTLPGEKPASATQLIGWDPEAQQVRSFMYDSRGGFTVGYWTNEGDAWSVKSVEMLPNGKRNAATRLYSRIDENTAVWESIDDEPSARPGAEMRLRLKRKTASQ